MNKKTAIKREENENKTMEIEVEVAPDTWITETVAVPTLAFTMATDVAFEILSGFEGRGKTNFAVYMTLLKHRNSKNNKCFPSIETIADKIVTSDKTVKRALDELEKAGYIKIDSGMRGISNNYYFPKEWFYDLFEKDYKQIKANRRRNVMKSDRRLKAEKERDEAKAREAIKDKKLLEKDRKIAELEKKLAEKEENDFTNNNKNADEDWF